MNDSTLENMLQDCFATKHRPEPLFIEETRQKMVQKKELQKAILLCMFQGIAVVFTVIFMVALFIVCTNLLVLLVVLSLLCSIVCLSIGLIIITKQERKERVKVDG